jgi:G3E family GTPase
MNPRAPITGITQGAVPLDQVLDLRGFNLNDKLEIDPHFLEQDDHDHANCGHDHHEHGPECNHDHHGHTQTVQFVRKSHTDKIQSFVFKSERPFDSQKLEDFLGGILSVFGAKMLRYKGVLYIKGGPRKVIIQGVHEMMGSDLGAPWGKEKKETRMVFIGTDLPKDVLLGGLETCLV